MTERVLVAAVKDSERYFTFVVDEENESGESPEEFVEVGIVRFLTVGVKPSISPLNLTENSRTARRGELVVERRDFRASERDS